MCSSAFHGYTIGLVHFAYKGGIGTLTFLLDKSEVVPHILLLCLTNANVSVTTEVCCSWCL